jgi:uncharacterized protein DUF6962
MRTSEPMTMLTDYLLAVAALVLALRLFRSAGPGAKRCVRLWAWGFLILTAAALTGGSFHGWALYLADSVRRALWNVTVYLIGFASALMIAGTAVSRIARRDESARWLLAGLSLSLLGLAVQQSTVQLGPSFNHNDIYHCIQIAALWPFYRGARLLEDR